MYLGDLHKKIIIKQYRTRSIIENFGIKDLHPQLGCREIFPKEESFSQKGKKESKYIGNQNVIGSFYLNSPLLFPFFSIENSFKIHEKNHLFFKQDIQGFSSKYLVRLEGFNDCLLRHGFFPLTSLSSTVKMQTVAGGHL